MDSSAPKEVRSPILLVPADPSSSPPMGRRLRVLLIGSSESNRRRIGSIGLEANLAWSQQLLQRYQVMGYWPAFLMHGIDALVEGRPLPTVEALAGFGRDHYLYDRDRHYHWRHGTLWNTATPAANLEGALRVLSLHTAALQAWPAELVVTCLGSIDRNGCAVTWTKGDMLELSPQEPVDHETRLAYPPCETVETFAERFERLLDFLEEVQPAALKVFLGTLPMPAQSRRLVALSRAFDQVMQTQSEARGHLFVDHAWVTGSDPTWLMSDNHPTDALNEAMARAVLTAVGPALLARAGV